MLFSVRGHDEDVLVANSSVISVSPVTGQIRVTRHALVMLKLLALADRYNIRGPKEARHDREEAQTHASDIVSILRAVTDIPSFNTAFVSQFQREPALGIRSFAISPTTSAN
jgi:hypothetical protein